MTTTTGNLNWKYKLIFCLLILLVFGATFCHQPDKTKVQAEPPDTTQVSGFSFFTQNYNLCSTEQKL